MNTDNLVNFLKKFSSTPNTFIDDMFALYDPDTLQTDHVVNLDAVAKWLQVRKGSLMDTLQGSYKRDIDYVIKKMCNPHVAGKYGKNTYKHVLITPDCFKRLCMRSRGKMAEAVRSYFIDVESLVIRYRQQMMKGIEEEMLKLEKIHNVRKLQRPSESEPKSGYIYVLRASDKFDSVYKIGRTRDLTRRLREHNASRADFLDVVFTLKCADVKAVETCVRGWLNERQWKRGAKYKEVYKADIDMVKQIIHGCDAVGSRILNMTKHSDKITGGAKNIQQESDRYFIIVI